MSDKGASPDCGVELDPPRGTVTEPSATADLRRATRTFALKCLAATPLALVAAWLIGGMAALGWEVGSGSTHRYERAMCFVGSLTVVWVALNLWLYRTGTDPGQAGRGVTTHPMPPVVVQFARILAAMTIAFWTQIVCLLAVLVLAPGQDAGRPPAPDMVAPVAVAATMVAMQAWLIVALGRGRPAGWMVQLVLAVLWLLAFPIGTVIGGGVLQHWDKPATRAWFGLPGRR